MFESKEDPMNTETAALARHLPCTKITAGLYKAKGFARWFQRVTDGRNNIAWVSLDTDPLTDESATGVLHGSLQEAKAAFVRAQKAKAATVKATEPEVSIQEQRATFRRLRDALAYDTGRQPTDAAITAVHVGQGLQPSPVGWIKAAQLAKVTCPACNGTGHYRGPSGGICFRCEGKGHQTAQDGFRNRAYDNNGRRF